jgi:hypothetical protein
VRGKGAKAVGVVVVDVVDVVDMRSVQAKREEAVRIVHWNLRLKHPDFR